ncbi:ubiquinol oxidase subunit II [Novosphingobium mangrovi (ex Hu et al. 2023)]|uniref:Ubiquinol oxidase polypeptide II n=1 Tax=Novosphingobium mangrovi (ex Hu et al. 2023) TaxID=2930094 RepID=A0ABT0ACY7_9SPHN|nr:ubiquinol oxidase subunit II [Novosphingobium mangrovi (ex Hu et al. 2023)]MCJ1961062.1 ubiquinol oxidase subunit II [Novosphingobium mangrovi (ex Hu et al. 2023)]
MRSPESRTMPRRPVAPPRAPVTRIAAALALTGALSACNTVVLKPAGDVAQQQGDLVVISTLLMLLIIVPVIALTLFFAFKYRASNKEANYQPDWDHSTQLELVIWAAPLLIIICLGALTWVSTHLLDPYRTIGRIDSETPISAQVEPLEVDVVALDWKWLFIYPEQGVATVNELVVPTNRPLHFRITASSVMNSFYVPAMAGQIYAMPGMETRLNAVMNRTGDDFVGFSANYSGAGFSGMRFPVRSVDDAGFASWVADVKDGGEKAAGTLDAPKYLDLEKPSENVPAMHFANVDAKLYGRIVDMCVEPGKMCMSEMMAIDARGGLGKAGIHNVEMLTYDKHGREAALDATRNPDAELTRELAWVRALCEQEAGAVIDNTVEAPEDKNSLTGFGLSAPQSLSLAGQNDPQSTLARPSKTSRN